MILWLFFLYFMKSSTTYWAENCTRVQPIWEPRSQKKIQKSLRTGSYSWENLRINFEPGSPQMQIHGDSQSENQTENRDENQVLLWEPPNTGPDYWSGPPVASN
jgi:hypothetical protein